MTRLRLPHNAAFVMHNRRVRTRRALAGIVAALILGGLAASLAPVSAGPESGAQTPAPVTVSLYRDSLEWSTLPHHFATAYVTHTEGLRDDGRGNIIGQTGLGHGRADAAGRTTVRLNSGHGRKFLPFDTVSLISSDWQGVVGEPYHLSVPELRVDVSPDGSRVLGRAAPGAAVALTLDTGLTNAAVATAAGDFAWSLAPGARLGPGQGGWATITDAVGNRFRARFVAFSVRLTVRQAVTSGWITPASTGAVTFRISLDDGRIVPRRLNLSAAEPDGRIDSEGLSGSALPPGTPYTVTVTSPVVGERSMLGAAPAELSVEAASATGVQGRAPAGASLSVEIYAPDRTADAGGGSAGYPTPVLRLATTAEQTGEWRIDVPPGGIQAGSRVVAVLDAGATIEHAASTVVPRFTVAVDGARLLVQLPAYSRARVSVWASDGSAIGSTGQLGSGASGEILVDLGLKASWWESKPLFPKGELSALMRGGVVEVEVGVTGDPIRVEIPELVARSDTGADMFAGTAPPGAVLDIEVIGPEVTALYSVTVGTDGEWELALAGEFDVAPGVGARVWLQDAAGHRFYADTAPVRIVASPDRRHLDAAPWSGRPLRAEVRDADGRVVGITTMPADEGPNEEDRRLALTTTIGNWLVDSLSQEPLMLAGDTVWVKIGDDEATWVLPPLEGRIHPDLDLVIGVTDPGATVDLNSGEYDDPLVAVHSVVADETGAFHADLAGQVDIKFGEGVFARRYDGDHILLRYIYAPGLSVHMDRAAVSGVLEPRVAIDVSLRRDGQARAGGRTVADAHGRFGVTLRDAAGAAVLPEPADEIAVDAAEAQLFGHMTLEVPPLTFEVEPDGLHVGGSRQPGGYLSAGVGRGHQGWPLLNNNHGIAYEMLPSPPDRWAAELQRPIEPGHRFGTDLYLTSGHGVLREWVEPILALEHGGTNVCGLVQPFDVAELSLLGADGTPRAELVAAASEAGRLIAQWRDEAGEPVRSGSDDRVVGRVGRTEIAVELGVVTATLNLGEGRFAGQIRPGARPYLTAPSRDCLFRLSSDDQRWLDENRLDPFTDAYGYSDVLPDDGQIRLQLPPEVLRGRGIDVHFDSAGRHRIYRTVYQPLVLTADVTTGRVSGHAVPGALVSLTLRDEDGRVLGATAAEADPGGDFEARFRRDDGAEVALGAGVRVEAVARAAAAADVTGYGEQSAAMVVEALDVDPSGGAIVGFAPAGRTVGLALRVAGGPAIWTELAAGADGRFGFTAADIPPRTTWSLADVTGGHVELVQDGGHRTVASWGRESRPALTVHLPWVMAGD